MALDLLKLLALIIVIVLSNRCLARIPSLITFCFWASSSILADVSSYSAKYFLKEIFIIPLLIFVIQSSLYFSFYFLNNSNFFCERNSFAWFSNYFWHRAFLILFWRKQQVSSANFCLYCCIVRLYDSAIHIDTVFLRQP